MPLKRAFAYSTNGGQSWSAVRYHPDLPEASADGGLAYLADQNAILVSHAASPGRRDLTISVSYDDGKTWPLSRLIHKGPAAYSELAVTPTGEILCLYEGGKSQHTKH